jgi:hypothetical protein
MHGELTGNTSAYIHGEGEHHSCVAQGNCRATLTRVCLREKFERLVALATAAGDPGRFVSVLKNVYERSETVSEDATMHEV